VEGTSPSFPFPSPVGKRRFPLFTRALSFFFSVGRVAERNGGPPEVDVRPFNVLFSREKKNPFFFFSFFPRVAEKRAPGVYERPLSLQVSPRSTTFSSAPRDNAGVFLSFSPSGNHRLSGVPFSSYRRERTSLSFR